MLTVEDILLEFDGGLLWPIKKYDSALATTYMKLRMMLDNGENYIDGIFSPWRVMEERAMNSNDMAILYQNEDLLQELSNRKYIYLTPTKFVIRKVFTSPEKYGYVAILKKEGRIGYLVLILDTKVEKCSLTSHRKEVYGSSFNVMEILSDGTTILFNKTVSWEYVRTCRVNTTSIMNLFFNKEEIKLVGSVVDSILSNQESNKGEAYFYHHKEGKIF